jgi:hypothetical protein
MYITPDVLTAFAGLHEVYLTDFHAIWEKWSAKNIKGPIRLSTEINDIDRSGQYPVIKFKKDYWETLHPPKPEPSKPPKPEAPKPHSSPWSGWQSWWGTWPGQHGAISRFRGHNEGWYHEASCEQQCSDVILAFPPTSTNLRAVGLDLTPEEQAVFPDVHVNNYYSAAVKFNLPFGVSYVAASESPFVPPPDDGEPVAVLRLWNQSDIVTSWSWGPYLEFQSQAFAEQLLKTSLSKINKDPRDVSAASEPVTQMDVRAFRKWDYFPHFDTQPLADNVYERFNALQGQKNTYFSSTLSGFEIVEWAIRTADDIVDSYF